MDKVSLRKKFITQRKELNKDDVAERSKVLVKIILDEVDLSKIEKIHCFLPIVDDNEPDLRSLITHLLDQDIKVYTSNPPNKEVQGLNTLKLYNFNLGQDAPLDLIIVPMLAYDPVTNHRLGFGGGFYDKLLKSQPNAQKIGVCFKEFSRDNLPVEPHDQPLQKIFAV